MPASRPSTNSAPRPRTGHVSRHRRHPDSLPAGNPVAANAACHLSHPTSHWDTSLTLAPADAGLPSVWPVCPSRVGQFRCLRVTTVPRRRAGRSPTSVLHAASSVRRTCVVLQSVLRAILRSDSIILLIPSIFDKIVMSYFGIKMSRLDLFFLDPKNISISIIKIPRQYRNNQQKKLKKLTYKAHGDILAQFLDNRNSRPYSHVL